MASDVEARDQLVKMQKERIRILDKLDGLIAVFRTLTSGVGTMLQRYYEDGTECPATGPDAVDCQLLERFHDYMEIITRRLSDIKQKYDAFKAALRSDLTIQETSLFEKTIAQTIRRMASQLEEFIGEMPAEPRNVSRFIPGAGDTLPAARAEASIYRAAESARDVRIREAAEPYDWAQMGAERLQVQSFGTLVGLMQELTVMSTELRKKLRSIARSLQKIIAWIYGDIVLMQTILQVCMLLQGKGHENLVREAVRNIYLKQTAYIGIDEPRELEEGAISRSEYALYDRQYRAATDGAAAADGAAARDIGDITDELTRFRFMQRATTQHSPSASESDSPCGRTDALKVELAAVQVCGENSLTESHTRTDVETILERLYKNDDLLDSIQSRFGGNVRNKTTGLTPHKYQVVLADAAYTTVNQPAASNAQRRSLVYAPTGTGKSIMIGYLVALLRHHGLNDDNATNILSFVVDQGSGSKDINVRLQSEWCETDTKDSADVSSDEFNNFVSEGIIIPLHYFQSLGLKRSTQGDTETLQFGEEAFVGSPPSEYWSASTVAPRDGNIIPEEHVGALADVLKTTSFVDDYADIPKPDVKSYFHDEHLKKYYQLHEFKMSFSSYDKLIVITDKDGHQIAHRFEYLPPTALTTMKDYCHKKCFALNESMCPVIGLKEYISTSDRRGLLCACSYDEFASITTDERLAVMQKTDVVIADEVHKLLINLRADELPDFAEIRGRLAEFAKDVQEKLEGKNPGEASREEQFEYVVTQKLAMIGGRYLGGKNEFESIIKATRNFYAPAEKYRIDESNYVPAGVRLPDEQTDGRWFRALEEDTSYNADRRFTIVYNHSGIGAWFNKAYGGGAGVASRLQPDLTPGAPDLPEGGGMQFKYIDDPDYTTKPPFVAPPYNDAQRKTAGILDDEGRPMPGYEKNAFNGFIAWMILMNYVHGASGPPHHTKNANSFKKFQTKANEAGKLLEVGDLANGLQLSFNLAVEQLKRYWQTVLCGAGNDIVPTNWRETAFNKDENMKDCCRTAATVVAAYNYEEFTTKIMNAAGNRPMPAIVVLNMFNFGLWSLNNAAVVHLNVRDHDTSVAFLKPDVNYSPLLYMMCQNKPLIGLTATPGSVFKSFENTEAIVDDVLGFLATDDAINDYKDAHPSLDEVEIGTVDQGYKVRRTLDDVAADNLLNLMVAAFSETANKWNVVFANERKCNPVNVLVQMLSLFCDASIGTMNTLVERTPTKFKTWMKQKMKCCQLAAISTTMTDEIMPSRRNISDPCEATPTYRNVLQILEAQPHPKKTLIIVFDDADGRKASAIKESVKTKYRTRVRDRENYNECCTRKNDDSMTIRKKTMNLKEIAKKMDDLMGDPFEGQKYIDTFEAAEFPKDVTLTDAAEALVAEFQGILEEQGLTQAKKDMFAQIYTNRIHSYGTFDEFIQWAATESNNIDDMIELVNDCLNPQRHTKYMELRREFDDQHNDLLLSLYRESRKIFIGSFEEYGTGLDYYGTQTFIKVGQPKNIQELRQADGRPIRMDSHAHLPEQYHDVDFYHIGYNDMTALCKQQLAEERLLHTFAKEAATSGFFTESLKARDAFEVNWKKFALGALEFEDKQDTGSILKWVKNSFYVNSNYDMMRLLGEGLQSDEQEDAIDSIESLLKKIIEKSEQSRLRIENVIYGAALEDEDFESEKIPQIAAVVYYLTLYGFFDTQDKLHAALTGTSRPWSSTMFGVMAYDMRKTIEDLCGEPVEISPNMGPISYIRELVFFMGYFTNRDDDDVLMVDILWDIAFHVHHYRRDPNYQWNADLTSIIDDTEWKKTSDLIDSFKEACINHVSE